MIIDIHTHNHDAPNALICVEPSEFAPSEGKLYAVGIHPWHAATGLTAEIERLKSIASHPQVAAIGETGLDSRRGAPLNTQTDLFLQHIALAEHVGKPLIVHMVRTSQVVLKLWRASQKSVPWVIHGMRGNPNVAHKLIDAGFYFSFGAKFNPDTLKAVPTDKILAETDDSPQSIDDVIAAIAATLGISSKEAEAMVSRNAATLLMR